MAARTELEDWLKLASLAFHPSYIAWDRFYNPTLTDWPQMGEFCRDPLTNPFIPLCRQGLAARLHSLEPDLVVIMAASASQAAAALSMARFCRQERPPIPVALWGDHPICAGPPQTMQDIWDYLPLGRESEQLMQTAVRLAGLGNAASGPSPAAVNQSLGELPLPKYLAPEMVLLLDDPLAAEDDIGQAAGLMGAKGFLLPDQNVTPAQLRELTGSRPGLCLGLKRDLRTEAGEQEMTALHQAGVRLIQWRTPAALQEAKPLSKTLAAASMANIWNHVEVPEDMDLDHGLMKFILANPNIAHSWSRATVPGLFSALPSPEATESGAYPPLPGRPFGRELSDPAHLLLYAGQYGAEKLKRWRVRADGSSIYATGQNINYDFRPPDELPPGYLEEVIRLVLAGGSGSPKWVEHNLRRAYLIGLALEEGAIVGAGSLKHPRPEYVESVRQRSGVDLTGHLERGYTTVRPQYRGLGIGTKLLEGETARAQAAGKKVFSIIGEDNIASQKMALRNNTRKVATFYSQQMEKEMGVWMPQWMLEQK